MQVKSYVFKLGIIVLLLGSISCSQKPSEAQKEFDSLNDSINTAFYDSLRQYVANQQRQLARERNTMSQALWSCVEMINQLDSADISKEYAQVFFIKEVAARLIGSIEEASDNKSLHEALLKMEGALESQTAYDDHLSVDFYRLQRSINEVRFDSTELTKASLTYIIEDFAYWYYRLSLRRIEKIARLSCHCGSVSYENSIEIRLDERNPSY
jgi:hypothetical protein